jgi:hypothetical protein
MSKNNEKQIKNQLQRFETSSNQLTKEELLLIHGGDSTGKPKEEGGDENG